MISPALSSITLVPFNFQLCVMKHHLFLSGSVTRFLKFVNANKLSYPLGPRKLQLHQMIQSQCRKRIISLSNFNAVELFFLKQFLHSSVSTLNAALESVFCPLRMLLSSCLGLLHLFTHQCLQSIFSRLQVCIS